MYASKVETAAMMNTARRLIAYESRAARCRWGGSFATSVEECLILLMVCSPLHVSNCGAYGRMDAQIFRVGTVNALVQLGVENRLEKRR